jgi:hypothetical protein
VERELMITVIKGGIGGEGAEEEEGRIEKALSAVS